MSALEHRYFIGFKTATTFGVAEFELGAYYRYAVSAFADAFPLQPAIKAFWQWFNGREATKLLTSELKSFHVDLFYQT